MRYLLAVGDLLIGLAAARAGRGRTLADESQNDEAFYRGKIAVAAFFAKNMLRN